MSSKIERQKEARNELYDKIEKGQIDLADTVKLIRKIYNLSQEDYAKKVGVSKFSVMNLERREGNPTWKNINKMLSPLNLELKVTIKG